METYEHVQIHKQHNVSAGEAEANSPREHDNEVHDVPAVPQVWALV